MIAVISKKNKIASEIICDVKNLKNSELKKIKFALNKFGIIYFRNQNLSSSNYLKFAKKLGITEWIHNWKKNGWKTAYKQQVKNKELWTELDNLSNEFEIKWSWVKAHANDKLNNEVDLIAREATNS